MTNTDIDTWRFSEDLDFTVFPDGPCHPDSVIPLIGQVLELVHEASGIDFSITKPVFKHADKYNYTEGKIYYRGPLNARKPARIKMDISGMETIITPTVLQSISHLYSDRLPQPAQIRCYSFEEVFAEKLRAMGQRGRPRDLYDIVQLFKRRERHQLNHKFVRSILEKKCISKNIPVPSLESIQNSATKSELISEWKNMLGYQMPELDQFENFWNELPNVFGWLRC